MSRTILFNNNATVPAAASGVTSPADVAEGRIAAFDADDFASGTLDLTEPLDEGINTIVFVQGGKEQPISTSYISVEDIKSVHPVPYVAPVAQVTTIGVETGEGEATIKVVEASRGYKPHRRISASVILDGKTQEQITNEFVNLLNKQYPKFVTASNASNDLVLTADEGVSFQTAREGAAETWDAVATTTPNFGTGTPEQVKEMEEIAFGQQANFLYRTYLPVNPPAYAQNQNYDLHTFLVRTNTTENIAKSHKYQEITIAAYAGATGMDLPVFFRFEEPST